MSRYINYEVAAAIANRERFFFTAAAGRGVHVSGA